MILRPGIECLCAHFQNGFAWTLSRLFQMLGGICRWKCLNSIKRFVEHKRLGSISTRLGCAFREAPSLAPIPSARPKHNHHHILGQLAASIKLARLHHPEPSKYHGLLSAHCSHLDRKYLDVPDRRRRPLRTAVALILQCGSHPQISPALRSAAVAWLFVEVFGIVRSLLSPA